MADMLIKHGYVLPMDGSPLKKSNVLIDQGRISYVGSEEKPAGEVIDASGCVVMPGLVNAHTHAGMTLLRGYADDLPLKQWLEDRIWPAEARLKDKDLYIGTMLGCLEMIRSGTTAFADMYIHVDSVARAVEESGIRAALSYGMIDFGDKNRADAELTEGSRFFRKWNGAADGRISVMYGPHAPNTCSREFLARVKDTAVKDNARIHIHVLETEAELNQMKAQYGICSVNMLDGLGFLGPDVLAAHCVWLSDGDVDILSQKSVNIAHCPTSNMKLASGVSPVPGLIKNGANVALGTDGCASNNSLDMFWEMKTAALLHKVNSMDPTVLPAGEVLKMATTSGAKALGIPCGQITVGNAADIILINMQKPHLVPVNDPVSHLVYAAKGTDVRTTIVNGRILMRDGVVECMDEDKIMENAAIAADNLVGRVVDL